MPLKKHGRQYDVVVFGATGYTGKFTAQHISTHFPTNLHWAVAGRSRKKLEEVVMQCQEWNPDRIPPSIEVCELSDSDLSQLAPKTFILLTTVGPYGRYGEHAFRACAENGTHYADVTGEVPFTARMIAKYASTAATTGALMFPQIGIESCPSDLTAWSLASQLRTAFGPSTQVRDVVVSLRISGAPSGGTLATALSMFDNFPFAEATKSYKPFALSPVPNPRRARPHASSTTLLARLTGLVRHPLLGLQTTSIANRTDGAIVERTWGLLASVPALQDQAYGPNFSFHQYMKAKGILAGLTIHFGLMLLGVVMVTPFLRRFVAARVTQPGDGAEPEQAKREEIEYTAVGRADVAEGPEGEEKEKLAYCRVGYKGPLYYLTGIFLAEAAATLLEEDTQLPGGVYTPACLGQPYIDRLGKAGFKFETKIVSP